MSSVVEICNLALSHLGDDATIASIDPPEGSAQAEHCARFYPMARDAMMEMHAWRFATFRAMLALTNDNSWDWAYAYAIPTKCLRVLSVLPASKNSDSESDDFDVRSSGTAPIILANTELASAVYVAKVTDASLFPPLFVDALSRLLASYLAGPVIKGDVGASMAQSQYQGFLMSYGRAVNSDMNQRKHTQEHVPSWMVGR